MNILKKAAAVLTAALMMILIPSAGVFGAETGNTASSSQTVQTVKIKASKKSVTVEEGRSVEITVSTGGAQIKLVKSSKNISCTAGKVKNGKFTLKVKGLKAGDYTVTVQDKSNKSNAVKIKVKVTEEVNYSFRSKQLYDSHYKKHGDEFGDITQEEYLEKANELIDNQSDSVLRKRSDDNDYLYFNKDTNEFLVLSEDGYIRTYFIPNSGIKYWERQ